MEGTEETVKTDSHLTSAAAFVEGGIQDAYDDACSICLEVFCESDPSTVTSCKHEFHLQCILEWCQRSSQCPMCWQPISLKDPTSQELLEAVERERSFHSNPSRNATIFRHPTLGILNYSMFLPVGVDSAELEERIIQHLAAAAAMGRARHMARRESHRNSRSSTQGQHPQFLIFSTNPNNVPSSHGPMPSSPSQRGEGEPAPSIIVSTPPSPPTSFGEYSPQLDMHPQSQAHQVSPSASGTSVLGNQHGTVAQNRSTDESSPNNQDRAGPSELQSFSESLKSRINAVSMRYKESITRSTRSWKDRFFSCNTSMADLGSEVRREVTAGIATVSRMMERLETRDSSRSDTASVSNRVENSILVPNESNNRRITEADGDHSLNGTGVQGTCSTSSGSN